MAKHPRAPFEGGCRCGAVRYQASREPLHVFYCHCRDCQKETGGPFATELYVPSGSVAVTGELRSFVVTGASGKEVTRQFCPRCGSPLFTHFEVEPRYSCVKACSLDDPSWARPEFHLYVKSKVPWFEIADGLPQLPADLD